MSDLRFDLYVILDEGLLAGEEPPGIVAALLGAGVRWFQYRDKRSDDRRFSLAASALARLCRPAGARLILNDRVEAVRRSGADGVHLGGGDMPVPAARRLLGGGTIIGRTVRGPDEASAAEREGADYLGAGSVHPTATKGDAPVIGLDGLSRVCRATRLPVVAVGGIDRAGAAAALAAGAAGLAVAGAVLRAPDPAAAARGLLEEIGRCRAEGGGCT
ncbi:MAG: thiamine phosphate synthase [bacterium]|nr:thiamine phosphate synthase [bacterium]